MLRCQDLHNHRLFIDLARRFFQIQINSNKGYYKSIVEGPFDGSCTGTTFVDREGKTHENA